MESKLWNIVFKFKKIIWIFILMKLLQMMKFAWDSYVEWVFVLSELIKTYDIMIFLSKPDQLGERISSWALAVSLVLKIVFHKKNRKCSVLNIRYAHNLHSNFTSLPHSNLQRWAVADFYCAPAHLHTLATSIWMAHLH